jgi:ABC-2 type transport system permease protein
MDKITTIVRKEWTEVFKNKLVLFTVVLLPLLLLVLPLGTLAFMERAAVTMPESFNDQEIQQFAGSMCIGLTTADCTILYTLQLFVLMLMILPVAIPVTIAAYSIVGEKTSRTLEPLLATPITTAELLIAKSFAAVVPAVAATWVAYLVFVAGVRILGSSMVFERFTQPYWLLAIFVLAPLLSLLSVAAAVMISSRTSDPRVAEQISAVVMLPVILLVLGQSVGLILIDQRVIVLMIVVIGLLDIVLLSVAVRLFRRETILTRWK